MTMPLMTLSIKQPWAWLICHGGKDVENRPFKSRMYPRGPILIHTGQRIDWGSITWLKKRRGIIFPSSWETSAIIGSAHLDECRPLDVSCDSEWADPGYVHWMLSQRDAFEKVIPCGGRLGLYDLRSHAPEAAALYDEMKARSQ